MRHRARFPGNIEASALAIIVAVSALAVSSVASAQAVDTSEWVCEFCPFESGHRGDYEVGASSVSEDSAYVGDATGYDEDGGYANVDGQGAYASENHRLRWRLEDLGLDSRSLQLEGSVPGTFDYALGYSELPRRQFDTTRSVFMPTAGDLALPAGWVRAPVTSGFAALNQSLANRDIESDRTIVEIGGRYTPGRRWSFSADYRRQEQDGVKALGGSYYTNAALLPVEIDYVTDEVDLGIQYAADRWVLALGWYLSDFENGKAGFGWQHPFTTVPGGEFAELAQPPDSRFQEVSISGSYASRTQRTHASFSAALGEIDQDEPFLAYTANSSLAPPSLPRSNLNGNIDTARFAFGLSARPTAKARFKLNYRHDERDNTTPQSSWTRVIADSFLSGEFEMNIPYSFERRSFDVSADYDLLDSVRISAGFDRDETERDFQEVREQGENTGWGRIRWRPTPTLSLDVRGGTAKREIDDRYDEGLAVSFGQNPLLRKYHLAYRYREFGELTLSYSPAARPISLTLNAAYADDSYTKSVLGLSSGEELRYGADLGWSVSESASLYLSLGSENMESEQNGGSSLAIPGWRAVHDDEFTTLGAGFRIRNIADRVDLRFDYTRTDGGSDIAVDSSTAGVSQFPELETSLDFARVEVAYRQSARLQINLDLRYQRFKAEDWALEGVGPATIPVVLSLGARPYSPDVYIVGLGFRYAIGGSGESAED